MKNKYYHIITIIILFFIMQDVIPQIKTYGKIYPFNDSKNDESFQSFIFELKDALNNKNKDYIYKILDPKIAVSFGNESGISGFKEIWNLDNPESKFWEIFSNLINLGFIRNLNGEYNFPYYWGSKQLEGFECDAIIVINAKVKVFSLMNPESKILGTLTYDIVKGYETSGDNENWFEIEVNKNKKGYIKINDACCVCDYRGGFEYKNGKWILTWFLAGD